MDMRDEENYINTLQDLNILISEVREIRSRIIFGDILDDEGEKNGGDFTEIACLLTKASNYAQLAEMDLQQARILLREQTV